MILRSAAAVLVAFFAVQPKVPPLRPIAPLDLGRALDAYAEGRFDAAVTMVAAAGDEAGRNLRRHWPVEGAQWIDADPEHRGRRARAAAAFALETEHLRAERGDWRTSDNPPCAAACVLDWAQQQLVDRDPADTTGHGAARSAPDNAEREWYLAAAALAGGVRDWRYLQRPVDPLRQARVVPGLMDRALARFPGDAALRLEQAIAAAGRFDLLVEDGHRRLASGSLRGSEAGAIRLLTALAPDEEFGAEARLRLGFLLWAVERDDEAERELAAAAAQARGAEGRYLAHFLLGWTAATRGDRDVAIAHLEDAQRARPGSQSAAVLLAGLELQRGAAIEADAVARAALDRPDGDLDPWRLFLYGHHPQWPARIAALRREVSR